MKTSAHRSPWSLGSGGLIALAGLVLVAFGLFTGGPPVPWVVAAVAAAAVLELIAGISLMRHHGAAIAHILGGAITLAFAGFIVATAIIDASVASPAPVALIIGVYCVTNGIVRGLDVAIDRPRAALVEGLDAVVTLILGVVTLSRWGSATAGFVAVIAGLELAVRGLSLAGSARVAARHPELTPYHGREERFSPFVDMVEASSPRER